MRLRLLSFYLVFVVSYQLCLSGLPDISVYNWPTVGISVLIRNKAHSLPYFFSCLENLDYPKYRMYIWIHSDFNEDESIEIINAWAEEYSSAYTSVYLTLNSTSGPLHNDEEISTQWSPGRFRHVIKLREEAFTFAMKRWADYHFMLDADVYLTNPQTLKELIAEDHAVVAPMLISDGLYSNFWCGMTPEYYYKRTERYEPIRSREELGCFAVPMVHSAVLVDVRRRDTRLLAYDPRRLHAYDGPEDDIITFAVSAHRSGVALHVCNAAAYGYVQAPLEERAAPRHEADQLTNIKLVALARGEPLPLERPLAGLVRRPAASKLGLDEIYMINLRRRPERRRLMQLSFQELGMDVNIVDAVDGRLLDVNSLNKLNITLMKEYEDPYHKRPMNAGEIGCFLSHYNIWKEVAEKEYGAALVLEDDVHFAPYFRHKFRQLMDELRHLDWDLVYIGRKVLSGADEEQSVGARARLVRPRYSYWTLGYVVSARGAGRLLAARPLRRLLPVDEFLPLMFDQHPNDTWKAHFPRRTLRALSASPLLVHPARYTGEEGYVSDTEDSPPAPLAAPPEPLPAPPAPPARTDL